jgi:competence protein ComEA
MKEGSWTTALGWTAGDRWFFAVISAVMLAALSVHVIRRSGWGLKPITIHRPADRIYEFQLDVNKATWVEWMQLEGIGETLARRIVEDRETNGPFQSVEDVSRVKGVGDATLVKIKPWLRIEAARESQD